MNDGEKHQEIIIIKRGGDGEEGHHGGAWKIAFADFMTAMMALFLVLWLINAANEETKKAVASYFNPVKLVDRNRSVKGLHDAEGVQDVEMTTPNEQFPETENKETPTETISENQTEAEAQFFSDPFAALDEIAAHEVPGIAKSIEEEGGRNGDLAINDAEGGESFMDPFSPNFWNEEVRHANDNRQLAGNFETSGEADDAADEMRLEVPATTEEIGGQAGLQGDPEAQLETASLNAEDGDTGGAAAKQARLPRQIELEDAAGAETKPETIRKAIRKTWRPWRTRNPAMAKMARRRWPRRAEVPRRPIPWRPQRRRCGERSASAWPRNSGRNPPWPRNSMSSPGTTAS